jgi:hypothetical protein
LLDYDRIVSRRNVCKIAGYRMTCIAFAGAVEIFLACFGITYYDIQDLITPAMCGRFNALMEKCGNIGNLLRAQSEFRHAFVRPAVQNDGADLIAALIIEHQDRAKQVRTSFSPFGIGAVAEAAGSYEQCSTALDSRRIIGGIASSSATASASGLGLWGGLSGRWALRGRRLSDSGKGARHEQHHAHSK